VKSKSRKFNSRLNGKLGLNLHKIRSTSRHGEVAVEVAEVAEEVEVVAEEVAVIEEIEEIEEMIEKEDLEEDLEVALEVDQEEAPEEALGEVLEEVQAKTFRQKEGISSLRRPLITQRIDTKKESLSKNDETFILTIKINFDRLTAN
jgi:hypothetical protein